MKKRIVAMLMVAAFVLSTTACAKDTNANSEENVAAEASVEASEEVKEAVEEASEEASSDSSDESSEEASEGKDTADSLDDIAPDKVYKNEEFGIAVVIDDDMKFLSEDFPREIGDSFGTNADTPMVEAFSLYNCVIETEAESDNGQKSVEVEVADLSKSMTYPESAFVELSAIPRKIQLEKDFDEIETETEEKKIMGETHSINIFTVKKDGRTVYMSQFYLIKDGRLLTVSVFSPDKDSAYKIFDNLRKLN